MTTAEANEIADRVFDAVKVYIDKRLAQSEERMRECAKGELVSATARNLREARISRAANG